MAFSTDKTRQGAAGVSTGGYEIPYSCRFDGTASYFSRTPASASNRKTWTLSAWYKRGKPSNQEYLLGAVTDIGGDPAVLSINEALFWHTGGSNYRFYTSALYRDPSAWMHIVFSFDTSTAGGRAVADMMRIYVNGVLVTDKGSTTNPIVDYDGNINNDELHTIGRNAAAANSYCTGTIAEVHFIDGTALTPTSFGESGDYGEWKPIEVEGLTYGTNGYYLDFADSAALGNDVSGNNNDWTANSLTASSQVLDSCTNNFCTLNPLSHALDMSVVIKEGNLQTGASGSSGAPKDTHGTIPVTTGKWYFETHIGNAAAGNIGIFNLDATGSSDFLTRTGTLSSPFCDGEGWGFVLGGGNKEHAAANVSWDSAPSVGDIVQTAFDMDAGKIWWGKNNTWLQSGDPAAGSSPAYDEGALGFGFAIPVLNAADGAIMTANFGQDSSFAGAKTAQGNGDYDFYYTPPSGFKALCTANLPEPAVTPSEHFNTVLYTGDGSGSGSQAITGVGFQPDLVWLKSRSQNWSHSLINAIAGEDYRLRSQSNGSEQDITGQFAFGADGFTVTDGGNSLNNSPNTYVAWNWLANGAGASNSEGSRTATVSANVDAGFSIVGFEGESGGTVGHGLSKAPEIVIMKNRDATDDWNVRYGLQDGTSDYMKLSGREGKTDSSIALPSATLINLGTAASEGGQSGEDYIAYCFHSVEGFSKCGVYTGNNSTDGTFAYTGFRPAWIMIKRTHSWAGDWHIHDTKRNTYNLDLNYLLANEAESEATSTNYSIDILSNGFKCRSDHAEVNDLDGGTNYYIYLAFAETPFKYSNAR